MNASGRTLGIFGTSGFARETRDIAAELGYRCVFIAASEADTAALAAGDDVILEAELDRHAAGMRFSIGIGENRIREKIAVRHAAALEFVNLVHPSASFGWGHAGVVHAARGVIVCAGVRFTNSIQVGNFSIFNLNATIGHDTEIGDFVNVSPGANVSGNVRIGKGCWIGTGSAINQGQPGAPLVIGEGTVVGSGAVVNKACDPGAVYAGVPARRIR
jgi:sugar O-acyltransferase (sialic acid O-acetyltransferase NeuD family)